MPLKRGKRRGARTWLPDVFANPHTRRHETEEPQHLPIRRAPGPQPRSRPDTRIPKRGPRPQPYRIGVPAGLDPTPLKLHAQATISIPRAESFVIPLRRPYEISVPAGESLVKPLRHPLSVPSTAAESVSALGAHPLLADKHVQHALSLSARTSLGYAGPAYLDAIASQALEVTWPEHIRLSKMVIGELYSELSSSPQIPWSEILGFGFTAAVATAAATLFGRQTASRPPTVSYTPLQSQTPHFVNAYTYDRTPEPTTIRENYHRWRVKQPRFPSPEIMRAKLAISNAGQFWLTSRSRR